MANEYPFVAFRFDVQLEVENGQRLGLTNPLCDAAFAECDGLEMSMEPKTVRQGGDNTRQIHLAGRVSYSNLQLKRGVTRNLDLWKWLGAAAGPEGRGSTARGVIVLRDAAGAPQVRFSLSGCLPIKMKAPALNAKDGQLAIEEMHIAYGFLQVEAV